MSNIRYRANVYVNQIFLLLPILTQSLHFRRCSILPFFCFGVSRPQYIQAFSRFIARDLTELMEDGDPEWIELTMLLFLLK